MPADLSPGKLKILICDDDPIILERLLHISRDTLSPSWNTSFLCTTDPASPSVTVEDIQIAVLDIVLVNENGILLAQKLLQQNPDCQIVFVSGYPRYVSDVYDVPHLGMVLKDQLELQLPKFLLRAVKSLQMLQEKTLSVPVNRSLLQLNLSSILYLERRAHTTSVYLITGKEIRTRAKLGELLSQVCVEWLCRCHVSYVVNLCHVASLEGRSFILVNGEHIPISRVYLQNVKAAYYRFIQSSI